MPRRSHNGLKGRPAHCEPPMPKHRPNQKPAKGKHTSLFSSINRHFAEACWVYVVGAPVVTMPACPEAAVQCPPAVRPPPARAPAPARIHAGRAGRALRRQRQAGRPDRARRRQSDPGGDHRPRGRAVRGAGGAAPVRGGPRRREPSSAPPGASPPASRWRGTSPASPPATWRRRCACWKWRSASPRSHVSQGGLPSRPSPQAGGGRSGNPLSPRSGGRV